MIKKIINWFNCKELKDEIDKLENKLYDRDKEIIRLVKKIDELKSTIEEKEKTLKETRSYLLDKDSMNSHLINTLIEIKNIIKGIEHEE